MANKIGNEIESLILSDLVKHEYMDSLWEDYYTHLGELKSYADIDAYLGEEFGAYFKIVDNLASYIIKHEINSSPLRVCGFITGLVFQNDNWLINNEEFEYTTGYIETENRNCYGSEVFRGKGNCRHLSTFLNDVLKKVGFDSYRIYSSFYFSTGSDSELMKEINPDKFCGMEIFTKDNKKCLCDHMTVIFEYDGRMYMYDPLNALYSIINCDYALDYCANYGYVLSPASIQGLNNIFYTEFEKIINKIKSSYIVSYRSDVYELIEDGVKDAKEVDNGFIREHFKLYRSFLEIYGNRELYKRKYNDKKELATIRRIYKI